MSNDLNRCEFIGRLGKDPEMKSMPSGDAVCNFSIACGQSWKDKQTGEKKEKTDWIPLVAFKKLAEICGQYLKKGSQVYVSGRFQTRKWTDKEGRDRYMTEVVVDQMQMLGAKPGSGQQQAPSQSPAAAKPTGGGGGSTDGFDDQDIPF